MERVSRVPKGVPRPGALSLLNAAVKTLVEDWSTSLHKLEEIVANIDKRQNWTLPSISAEQGTLLTPVILPNKLACVSANYSRHLEEIGMKPAK